MSVFSELSAFLQQSLRTATRTVGSIDKTVDIANDYIDNNHKRITKNTKQLAVLSAAKAETRIFDELEADEELKARYAKLLEDW